MPRKRLLMDRKYCTKTLLWNFIGVRGEKYMEKALDTIQSRQMRMNKQLHKLI